MTGRIAGLAILICAVLAGGGLYYLQVYGFYEDVSGTVVEVRLTPRDGSPAHALPASDIRAIDADSSPIRFRACFTTSARPAELATTYDEVRGIDPRNAPAWFDCFDARAIAAALDAGTARAFIGEKNVAYGVDRIVVVGDDGQGFIWHELNDCGEKAYDGTVIGEECPPRPAPGQ